jgi:uncharacterized membrane protein
MALAALALSLLTSRLDVYLGARGLSGADFLLSNHPDGARAVLSAIAGSMITVAGVTFSMTIVSVSFAAAQFGPRLVGNFMRDAGNQFTLGVFIATFVYSLMILRTVRSADAAGSADTLASFVPQVSVLVAVALALACVAVLIYFIHHIPETINIGNITAAVGRQLKSDIGKLFPESSGADRSKSPTVEQPWTQHIDSALAVKSTADGYIESVAVDAIVEYAAKHDIVVRIEYHPGDFAIAGDILLYASPGSRVGHELQDTLRSSFVFGRERTPAQNVLFLVDELVEIMARALSPGVNDPFTAFSCINWLRGGLTEVALREMPSAYRHDDAGSLRVIVHPVSFERFAAAIFDQSLQYVSADCNATLHMLQLIAEVAVVTEDPERKRVLLMHAKRLATAASEQLKLTSDREAVLRRYEQTQEIAANKAYRYGMRDDQGWLGGRA